MSWLSDRAWLHAKTNSNDLFARAFGSNANTLSPFAPMFSTAVPMASQPGLSYTENFADIANWTDNFASGIGASRWGSVAANATGTIPDGVKTTTSTATFATSSTTAGVQRGSLSGNPAGTIVLLTTGSTDNSAADAIDIFLDYTGVNAGTLSFDWAEVNNSTGDRKGSLRVYTSTDGTTFTLLSAASVLNFTNNVASSGSITTVALPASFNNSSTARLRFYECNGTGGTTGSRPKVSIDNVNITATAASVGKMVTTLPGQTFTSGSGNSGSATAQTAGTSFNLKLTATLTDGVTTDTSYTGTKTISYSGPGGTPTYTTSVTFTSGQAASVPTTLKIAETTTITATDGTLNGVASSSLLVNPGAINSYVVSATSPQGIGATFNTTVTGKDANNNTVTTDSSTVVTMTSASGNVQFDSNGDTTFGDNTKPLSSGTFTISTKDSVAETTTITATDPNGKTGTSGSITFSDVTLSTDFFRSLTSGNWATPATWESSHDGTNAWITATAAPDNNANTVTIRNGHTVTVAAGVTVDQITVQSGGNLTLNSGVTLTVNNGTGDDIIVQNGGIFVLTANPTFSASATANINTGGTLRVAATGLTGNGAGVNASNFVYQDASILDYSITGTPSASGVTYFPNVNASTIPILRFTATPGSPGATNPTVVNGVLEVTTGNSITWSGTGTKTFRNGIRGAGNVDQSTAGQLIINGSTADIGGTGTLTLGAAGLQISSGTVATLSSNKTVNSNTLTVAGTLSCGTNAVSGTAAFTTTATSTLGIGSADGINSGTSLGNIRVSGTRTFDPGTSYTYNGSTAQVTGLGLSTTIGGLSITNSAGVTLSQATTASGTLTLTSGNLTTTSTNLLTISNTAAGAIAGGSSTSYVKGPLARILPASLVSGSTYSFPVGKAGFNPFEMVNPTTNAGGTVTIQAEEFDASSGGTSGVGIGALNTNRYWQGSITANSGNFTNTTVRLTDASVVAGNLIGKSSTQTGSYDSIGGTVSGSTITSNAITSFSFFNIGTADTTPPTITYTPLADTSSTANRVLATTITDTSGVPTSGAGLPVVYYRKGTSGAYSSNQCTFGSGSTYNCTLNYSLVSGVVNGNTIQYFVAAQDSATTPNSTTNPSTGASGFGVNPPSASTPTTAPNSYLITNTDEVFNSGSSNLAAGTYHDVTINNCNTFVHLTGNVIITGTLTINNCAHLFTDGFTVSGAGAFVLAAGGWLHITDANGITSGTTLSGNIQTTGGRSYSSTANYDYDGSGNQAVGNGLPASVNNLLISNTGVSPSNVVTNPVAGQHANLLQIIQGVYSGHSDYVDVDIQAAGTLSLAGSITVSGNWTNNGTFTPNGFTVTFNGTGAQTIATGGIGAGKIFANFEVNKSSGVATLAGHLKAGGVSVTAGQFDQGASFDITTTGGGATMDVESGALWTNTGTGDVNLSGGVFNAGTIILNSNGNSCGDNDDILIRSTVPGTQRTWSSTGTFSLTDVDVQDQKTPLTPPPAAILVNSGTNSGNNTGFVFVNQCTAGTYTWVGGTVGVNTDWQVPTNWSPARTTPAAGDILFIGAGTPSPTITNVAGAANNTNETIAALHVQNSSPTFSTGGGANTLTINAGAATGFDVSSLAITGANPLTIKLGPGTLGSVTGFMSVAGGAHRLISNDGGAITFQNGSIFTTSTGFTGNAFGDGGPGNGLAGSVIFASGSAYFHNAGSSPFGAATNPAVAVFQTGSEADWLTSAGFQASGRTYADLVIGSSSTATSVSDTGTGNFQFDKLTINAQGTNNSSLSFTGTGASFTTIRGNITSNGAGTGTIPDVTLTAPGGITINKSGTVLFNNDGSNARAINLDGNVAVTSGTTLTLSRIVQLGLSNPNSKTLTVNAGGALNGGSTGYVIGSLQRTFAAAGSQTFQVGAANGYSPVSVNATAGTFPATFTVSATGNKLTAISGTNALSRYWTITNNVGGNTADLTFNYLAGDVVGTEANYKFFRYNGSFTQFNPSSLNTGTHIATLNGVSTFSDWTLAEPSAVNAGTVAFVSAPYTDSETNADHVKTITVTRSGGSDGALDVTFLTSDGTAQLSDNDYAAVAGTLHWNAGETGNKTFGIPVKGDTTYEADETVNITLSNPSDTATITPPNPTTLTITNDDPAPAPTLGNYPATSIPLSSDTTVTSDAAPTNTTSINVSTSTDFKGKLEGNPATGIVRVTDAHPAGIYTVTVTAFNGSVVKTTKTFTLTVQTGTACAGASIFTNAPDVSVGSTPFSVAIGDFNGNGIQDIAVANPGSDTVSIRLGDGAGGFSGTTNVSVGSNPSSVAIGDFNGDGKQDIAVANSGSDTVSIRLGDGLGGFSGTTNVSVGGVPTAVAIGDFNNDGKQDLAVANYGSNTVSIRLGDGLGGFTGTTDVSVGSAPRSVAIGDFNNNGKQDIATANNGSPTVSIRLGACNLPPTIAAATGLSRQQGSPVSNSQVATVADDGGNGSVVVTVTSTNPSNGVSVSNIVNTGGNITADIIANCTATTATFTLQASDGISTATDTLTVTVTANTAPTLVYPGPQSVAFAGSLNVTPTTATDNGSITGYAVQPGHGLTSAPTVDSNGVVSITNAQPSGSHTITIRATDNCGATFDAEFTLNVSAAPPTLTVNKVTDPTSDTGLFNLQIDGSTAGTGANQGNGGTTGAITVSAASHTVGETAGTATTLSDYVSVISGDCASDGSITLAPGDSKVCTITNTRKPKLTITKTVIGDSVGRFNLQINSTQYATDVGNGGSTGAQYGTVGANTFGETAGTATNLADYTTVITGSGCTDHGDGTGDITLAVGDNKTCTITNTKKPKLTVNKFVVPATDTGTFDLRIDGVIGGTGSNQGNNGTTGAVYVSTGSHQVSELAHTGTDINDYEAVFGGACDSNGMVSLAVGETKVCTITNTRRPKLTVNKVLVPNTDPGKFNLTIDSLTSGTGSDVGDGGTTGPVAVSVGLHTVSETAGTGTMLTDYTTVISGDCAANGSITLNAGDVKTCTITNTRNAATCPTTPFVVTNTSDDPDTNLADGLCNSGIAECSLRAAIMQANALSNTCGTINIKFAIPETDLGHYYYKDDGIPNHVTNDPAHVLATTAVDDSSLPANKDADWPHGWWSIKPSSALPIITHPVVIDGYSQSGATANTQDATDDAVIRVELNGVNAGVNAHGLAANSVSTLQGLVINHFTGNGIGLLSGSSSGLSFSTVTGNFIGTDVSGTLAAPNGLAGLFVTDSNGHQVGCTVSEERNIISGNTGEGVSILSAGGNFVQGNFIGVAANGTSLLGNGGNGIEIYTGASNNTIGAITNVPAPPERTRPEGGASGCQRSGTGSSGAKLNLTPNIGGRFAPTQALSGANVIAGNGEDGVRVSSAGDAGNRISKNSIFSNSGLGINLGTDGVTANDDATFDSDTGPNNLQNFPVITGAAIGTITVSGTLTSNPARSFTIEVFLNSDCDTPNGYGEGQTYLVSAATTEGASGQYTWSATVPTITTGQVFTATATDLTTNDTSEFSACKTATSSNANPTIAAAGPLLRQQGTATINEQIATVSDADQPANTLTVTATPLTGTGVTISNITVDGLGKVKADVAASCTATNSTFTLTVTDNASATATATLTVNVTANTPPTLTYATPPSVTEGNSLTIAPATGPSDNGSISSIVVQSAGTYTGGISVNNSTGVVSITNAAPAGTHTITIRATDNCTTTTDAQFTLTVNGATCTPPPTGMVAWYPFDGNADDIKGSNSPTQTFGTPTFVSAKVGQGAKFDGSSGYGVASNANLNFAAGSFSIDGWVRVDALPATGSVLVEKRSFSSGSFGYVLSIDNTGTLFFTIQDGTNSAAVQSTPITDSDFHHIAVVVDRANSNSRIYVDAVLQQTTSTASVGSVTNTGRLFIGQHSLDSGTSAVDFNGVIDELEIFNTALSVTDIASIYNASFAGKCRTCTTPPAGMVSWWDGSGTGTTANDIQGTNNGTLQGGATFAPGKVGQAFSFNGTDSSILVPDSASLHFTTQLTLDAWVNPASLSSVPIIFSKIPGVAGNSSYELHLQPDGSIRANLSGNGSSYDNLISAAGLVPTGAWSHVATTFNAGLWKIYLNGVEVASKTSTVTSVFPGTANLLIGRDDGIAHFFNGLIDEAEVFNTALSQPQIAAIADAGNAGKCHTSTIQFSSANYQVTEGSSTTQATITVTRTGAHDTTAAVHYATSAGTATPGSDYTETSGDLNFAVGEVSKTFNVPILQDNSFSHDTTVNLTLSAVTGTGASLGSPNTAVLTIHDTDDTAPVFSITQTVTHNEGNASTTDFVFTVTKTGATELPATVDFTTAAGLTNPATGGVSCGAGVDYQSQNNTLTFQPSDATKTITVKVCGDVTYEANEQFRVVLSNPTEATVSPTLGTGTGIITNDDTAPTLSITSAVMHPEGNSGTTDFVFTVTKTGTTDVDATFNYATANGTTNPATGGAPGSCGTAGVDYETQSGTRTLAPSETTKDITIKACGDTTVEADETFFVNLSSPVDASITTSQGVGTIQNDDQDVTVAVSPAAVLEDGVPNLVYTFTRTGATANPLTVNFSVGGSATFGGGGADYTQSGAATFSSSSGTVVFTGSNTTATVTVDPSADLTFEPDETVVLTVASGAGYNAANPSSATGTILNDECTLAPLNMVSWWRGENNANDIAGPNSGTFAANTYAPGKVGQAFSFDGVAGVVSVPVSSSLDLTTNQVSMDGWIKPVANTTAFYFGRSAPSDHPYLVYFNAGSGAVHIIVKTTEDQQEYNTGYAPPLNVWTNIAFVYNGATMKLYANGVEVFSGAQTGNLVSSPTINFAIGNRTNTPAASFNGLIDEVELFNRALTPTEVGNLATASGAGKCRTSTIQFAQANTDSVETDSGSHTVNIPVTRNGDLTGAADVTYTVTDGTAQTADGDYSISPASGTLHWNSGDGTPKNIVVTVYGDTTSEADETVNLTLSNVVGATLGTPNPATLTIKNDDAGPTFTISSRTANEGTLPAGTTSFTFTVTRTGSTGLSSTVNFATADDTGGANPATGGGACGGGVDYISQAGMLTFPSAGPGSTSQTITVLVCRDPDYEANETFLVNLSAPTNATLGSPSQGVGTITNDDAPAGGFVVNTTNDINDGVCNPAHCSLREAINAANTSGGAVGISFAIPVTDPRHFYYKDDGVANQVTNDPSHVLVTTAANDAALPADKDPDWPHGWWSILPTAVLPTATQSVVIDGYTQAAATVNTLTAGDNAVLRIELDGASAGAGVTGLTLSGGGSILRGLAINRFTSHGVSVQSSSTITGDFIGTDVSGTLALSNAGSGVSCPSSAVTIGGSTPALVNLISGNGADGILLTGSNSDLILGNLIGTKSNGTTALPNGASGINVSGAGSVFNTIGGINAGEANTIAFNTRDGVRLADSGAGNVIRGNSIFSNGSTAADLGIDLGADGITLNDNKDPDSGPNTLQNFPVITAAMVTGSTRTIAGTLNSTVGGSFTIDFYQNVSCDTSGNGEGKTYLGSTSVVTDGVTGNGSFTFHPAVLTIGQSVTATATSDIGVNTSEFSTCFPITDGAPGAGDIQFTSATYSVAENVAGGMAAITLTRVGGTNGSISATFSTSDGTANQPGDYTTVNQVVTFGEGVSSMTINVPVIDDTRPEANETVNLSLGSTTINAAREDGPSGAVVNPHAAVLTINDNDPCPTTFTVNSNLDTSDANPGDGVCATGGAVCTLRAAIEEANALTSCGTIDINFSGVASPINLGTALPSIDHNVNFNGPGANLLTVQRSSAANFRIFTINSGKIVSLSGLTISNGQPMARGAGISNSGNLTVTNSTISGNSALVWGGGIYNDAVATLNITRSTISGNSAPDGGGIVNFGALTVVDTTISGNATTGGGGGIFAGSNSTLTITNSTISGNSASNGGGINSGGALTLANTTISGNTATTGGGGGLLTAGAPATATLTNVTITNNHGGSNGGGAVLLDGNDKLRNTIVAGNFLGAGTSTPDDIFGAVDTSANSSNNLIGTGGNGGLVDGSNGNQVGVANPGLGALMNNGGLTFTHGLLYNSPAVDAGNDCVFNNTCSPSLGAALTTDQRGLSRQANGDLVAGAHVDIGAYERQAAESRPVPGGSNVHVDLNDVRLAFPTVSGTGSDDQAANGGQPTIISRSVSITVIPVPGDAPATSFAAFDVTPSSAFYTAPVDVCFYLPSITPKATFDKLKVLHREGGVLTDHSTYVNFASKIACTEVTSFSDFVIGFGAVPSATSGTIDGTITDAAGAPLAGVTINLSGTQNGEAITNAQGKYSFDNVATNGFYTVTPARANYTFNPANRSFSALGAHTESSFTASANGDHANAIDTTEFFVRQQYLDFLGREPDPPGFNGWVNTLRNCAPGDASCDRIHVSESFFRSAEFQERGYFVYRFYSAALGRKPDYSEFTPDLGRVSGFLDSSQLEAAKTTFANDFITRPAFASQYNALSNSAYVDALINTAAVNLSNRQALVDELNAGTISRAQVLRQIAESGEVYQTYYNQAFVVMEYFGYLRRDPDALYLNWIQVLDRNPADSRHMVEGFVTSLEYRNRFAQ